MRLPDRTLAGVLFFVGSAQFLTAMMIGEAIWPDYNVGTNAISDLGTGSTAVLFNASVFLVGALSALAAYLLHRTHGNLGITGLLLLSGVGAMGVGIFPETVPGPHRVSALVAFLFGGLAAIAVYRLEPFPLNVLSIVLGALGLVSLGLFVAGTYGPLGFGGMERMIVYPVMLWEAAFGGYLMSVRDTAPSAAVGPTR